MIVLPTSLVTKFASALTIFQSYALDAEQGKQA